MFAALDDLELQEQCHATRSSGGGNVGVVFVAAPPGENSKGRKQRHRELRVALAERAGFTDPALATFFDQVLGNLPLSVALCGQMFRAEHPRIGSVAALVAEIAAISVDELSVKGRDAQTDTHYYGLARTVAFAVKRLEAAVGVAPAAKEAAVALLAVLARLPTDGAAAAELFKVPDEAMATDVVAAFARVAPGECPPPAPVVDLFRASAWAVAFAPACQLLDRYGLVRRGASGGQPLGSMHQMVQRCVREQHAGSEGGGGGDGGDDVVVAAGVALPVDGCDSSGGGLVTSGGATAAVDGRVGSVAADPFSIDRGARTRGERATWSVLSLARAVLAARYTQRWSTMEGPSDRRFGSGGADRGGGMRALDACVEVWCQWGMDEVGAASQPSTPAAIMPSGADVAGGSASAVAARAEADAGMLSVLGLCASDDDGVAGRALGMHSRALAFRQRLLPENHPSIATSMINLAETYGALGRHDEALKLQKETLAFRQRVLPENHPGIATSMGNLALTYSAFGRHDEALKLQKETLAFMQRVLPKNHPGIANSMGNLALTYGALGRHDEALKLHQETLALDERVLPDNHPNITTSMGNLAQTYDALGRHDEALKLQQETLAFRQRVLPENHPSIATSMNDLSHQRTVRSVGTTRRSSCNKRR
jgi:hypothetical protein